MKNECLAIFLIITLLHSFLLRAFINVFCQHTQLHEDFVCAVFMVGLRHATPSAIIGLMIPNLDMTSERVKSQEPLTKVSIEYCEELQ